MLSGIGTFILALYISQKRRVPEAQALLVLMAAVAVWCLAYLVELGSVDLAAKLFWAKVKYFGIVLVSPSWLILALQYTGRERWLKARTLPLLSIMPVVNLALVWTNHFHRLYWTGVSVKEVGSFTVLALSMGPGFWVCAAYSYLLMLIGVLFLFEAVLRSNPLYRKQAATMLVAALAPWVGNFLFLAGWSPLPHLDLAPFAFILTCLLCAWALFGLGFLDLVPIAHASIIDGINDSIIVLDRQNRIVECNPAGRRLVDLPTAEIIGRPFQEVLPALAGQFDPSRHEIAAVEDVEFNRGSLRRIYELRLSPLADQKGLQIGKVIVLRDMTEHRLTEENVRQQNEFLANVLESLTHPFYVLDAEDYTIKLANSAATQGDLSGKTTCYSLTHRNDRPCSLSGHACPLNQVKKTKKPVSMEHIHEEKDGTRKHFQVYGYPILDRQGNVAQMIEYHLDITSRRRMEEALRESEARLRTAIESLPFDLFILDDNGRYVMQNSMCKKRWGNIIGKKLEDVEGDEDNLRLWKTNNERAYRGEIVQGEVCLRLGPEKGYYYNITAPILDQGKVRGILGANIDITERKRMEEELAHHRDRLEELVKERTAELAEANTQLREEIAERRKKERALRESEEQYRSLFENFVVGIFTMDLGGNFVSCNPALEKVLGYSAEELTDKNYKEYVAPEAREVLFKEYNLLFQTGRPIRNFRYETIGKDGKRRTIETNVSLIKKDGRAIGFQGIAKDITDQARAEDALMESEERYRMLVNSSLTGILVVQDGKFQFANDRMEDLAGYTLEEVIGRPFLDLVHPDDRQQVTAATAERLAGNQSTGHTQFRAYRKDGAVMWYETFSVKMTYEGKPALLVNLLDVTEREIMSGALRENEARLRALLNACTDTAFLIDKEGNLLTLNETVATRFGKRADEMIGENIFDLIGPEATRARRPKLSAVIQSGKPLRFEDERAGILFDTNMCPIFDQQGAVAQLAVYARDITEQRKAEVALKKTLEELEQRVEERTAELSRSNAMLQEEISKRKEANSQLREKNKKLTEAEQMRDSLTNMIVHDMKNPITSNMFGLDLIAADPDGRLSDRQLDYLRLMKRNHHKLSEMIANLLELSKLEGGVVSVNKVEVDMPHVIHRIVEDYTAMQDMEGKTIHISVDESARRIEADQNLLERTLSNIISNAVRHSYPGDKIEIRVSREVDKNAVLVSVRDFGEGIPVEDQERIFNKFVQASIRKLGRRGDIGLGLAFCKMAVEALGGRLWVESRLGKGSCFSFSLPG
jgi:PAS domain S-box-containing protein